MTVAAFIWWLAVVALVVPFLDIAQGTFGPKGWVTRATWPRVLLGVIEVGAVAAWFLLARGRWTFFDEHDTAVAVVGALLALTGALFAGWARSSLGRLFSPQLGVQAEHTLVTRGPYAVVRHPMYLGMIDFIIGAALFMNDAGLLLVALVFLGCFVAQLRIEERLFAEHFGDEWREYAARTPALFPWKRRRPGG
jgi:protein-S-isoprenylcysteine O-methyltransferase Ste14